MKYSIQLLTYILLLCLSILSAHDASATSYSWNGTTGLWSDATKWIPNGVPGAGDGATINGGTCTLDAAININLLTLTSGSLEGDFNLTVSSNFNWSGGTHHGVGNTEIFGATTISNNPVLSARTLIVTGGGTTGINSKSTRQTIALSPFRKTQHLPLPLIV